MATRYVSTIGTDAGTALTEATAWATAEYADANATASDTIVFLPGTYTENPFLTATAALTWKAQTAGTVTLKSVDTTHLVALNGTTVKVFDGLIFDAEDLTTNTIYSANAEANCTIQNCTLQGANAATTAHHYNNNGSSDAMTFSNCTFSGAVRSSPFNCGAATNLTIDNCTFSTTVALNVVETNGATGTLTFTNNTGTITCTAANRALLNITESQDTVCSGNTLTFDDRIRATVFLNTAAKTGSLVYQNNNFTAVTFDAACIYAVQGTHDLDISGNTITTTGANAVDLLFIRNQPAPKIYNNTFDTRSTTQTGSRHIRVESTGTASHNPIIEGNTCKSYSPSGAIILVGADTSGAGDELVNDAYIANNTVYGPGFYGQTVTGIHGIESGYQLRSKMYGNKVYGCALGIVAKGGDTVATAQDWASLGGVIGNLLVDCDTSSGIRLKGLQNVLCINNTLISTTATAPNGMLHVTVGDNTEPAINNIIKNNIFKTTNDHTMISVDATSLTGMDEDYNQFFYTGTSIRVTHGASTYTTLGAIVTHDVNSQVGDPLFIDQANDDYTLQNVSPCVGAALNVGLASNAVGFTGEPFASFGIDIGGAQSIYAPFHPTQLNGPSIFGGIPNEYRATIYGDSYSDSGGGTGWIGETLNTQTSVDFILREQATGGDLVSEIRTAFEADFPHNRDNLVILQGVINSIRTDVPLTSIQEDWSAMADAVLQADNVGLLVVNQSPWFGSVNWTQTRQIVTEQFNAWLKGKYGNYLADTYTALGDPAEPRQLADEFYKLVRTDTHPSRNGDVVIDDNLGEILYYDTPTIPRDAEAGNLISNPNTPTLWSNNLRASFGGNSIRMCDGTYSSVNGLIPSIDAISHIGRDAITAPANGSALTLKILVKPGQHQWCKFEYKDNAGALHSTYVDMLNVVKGTESGSFTWTVVKAARGWLEIIGIGSSGTGVLSNTLSIFPAEADADINFVGDVRTPSLYADRMQILI